MPLKAARRRPFDPSFEGCSGPLGIVAKFRDGLWSLELWWNHAYRDDLVGLSGQLRRWRKLSRALEFAARRYPEVCSYQLLWPAPSSQAKVHFIPVGMADTSSLIGAPL